MYDYFIVGGGLAGSTLAYRLIKQGAKVMVMDDVHKNISSNVAAGIVNPITGKRTTLTWNAAGLFDELHKYYPAIEKELGKEFFNTMPTYKLFESIYEQNEWLNKQQVEGFEQFIEKDLASLNSEIVNNPFGALKILKSGRLDLREYLQTMHEFLRSLNSLKYEAFIYSQVQITDEVIQYEDMKSQAIIFCDGPNASHNPYFNYLPFKPVHGEMLEVEIPGFYEDRIINKGIFILPIGKMKFIVGSTYNWDETKPMITAKGRDELESKLKELINCKFTITDHKAGIRPSTKDRRPYLGRHPKFKNIFVFGGFGSKGVSLVPLLSRQFTNYLLHDVELPREVDICRVK